MPIHVETRDCAALTDADLDEMASMGGAFDIGLLSKAKEDWVLCTTARSEEKLHGFTFSTLERIGGTPCVLLGLMSVKRTSKRDQVLKGLMHEAYHRALMAFPDEDVVVGSRFAAADGLEAFKSLDELIPRPGHRAVGEERAWGRRLSKRFGVDGSYDEQAFIVKAKGQTGYLDHETLKPDRILPEVATMFKGVVGPKGGSLVVPWLGDGGGSRQARSALSELLETVIRRRRMTREFSTAPVAPELIDELIDIARRAPSAGFSQGVHFVVLDGEHVDRFWAATGGDEWYAAKRPALMNAPIIVLPFAIAAEYTARYSEPDKIAFGLDDAAKWPVPFWLTDTAMATQNLLLLVEDRGLGALYFGIFDGIRRARRRAGCAVGCAVHRCRRHRASRRRRARVRFADRAWPSCVVGAGAPQRLVTSVLRCDAHRLR